MISKSIYNRPSLRFSHYLAEFYRRRIIRIIPALVVCLFVTVVASTLFIPSAWMNDTIKTGLSAFWGYSNFALVWYNDKYFSPLMGFNPYLHTWSLAIEEQFYLLFPAIYYVWLKFRKGISGYISRTLLAVLGICSLGFAFFETNAFPDRAFYLLPGRFWELAAGALLFQLHSKNVFVLKSKNVSHLFMTTGVMLICIGFIFAEHQAFPFPWAIVPVLSTILLLTGIVSITDNLPYKFLSSSIMTSLGKTSYSIYLWHWPVAVLLRWTIGFNTYWLVLLYLVTTLILATVSYRLIETPIRTSRFLLAQKSWKIIV